MTKRTETAHDRAYLLDALVVVLHLVVRDAGNFRMHARAAERFVVDLLTDRRFYKCTAGEEYMPGAFDDHCFVRHDRQIRATGNAWSHDGRNLYDALRRHYRIVAEDAAEVLLVGENIVLHWQEHTGAIDQINNWQVILHRDLLRAKILLAGHRKPGACLHGSIIR